MPILLFSEKGRDMTIGDLINTSEEYYRKTGKKSSFHCIADACAKKKLTALVNERDDKDDSFMSKDKFYAFIKQCSADPQPNLRKAPMQGSQTDLLSQEMYIEESDLFREAEDIVMYIHVPYINDGLHSHDHFELNYVYYGTGEFWFGHDKRRYLSEGTLCITAPDSPHNMMSEADTLILSVMIRKSTFDKLFSPILKRDDSLSFFFRHALYEVNCPNYLLYVNDNSVRLQQYFQLLYREYFRKDEYSNANVISILSLILSEVLRQKHTPETFFDFSDNNNLEINFPILIQYVKQNYATVTLRSLAETFSYSESFFSKLVRKKTGESFSNIVTNLKLEQGKELLRNPRLTLDDIADSIGYNSASSFSRAFKTKYNISPKEYRRNWRTKRNELSRKT